jgi:hypothetical protein
MIRFADIADLLKKKYGVRCHVNTNRQEITLFEEGTGKVFVVTIAEKRFSGPSGWGR